MYKTLALATAGLIIAGATAAGVTQTARADSGIDSTSLVAQAQAITDDVEATCQKPLRDAALAATADPAAFTDLEAANARCAEIGQRYSYFVDVVQRNAEAVIVSIPEEARAAAEAAMAAVTPEVRAQMDAGDTEGAIHTLFGAVAPQFDLEGMVGQ